MSTVASAVRARMRAFSAFVFAIAGVALASMSTEVARAANEARDPIEGRWWGQIGSTKERIDVGLEFRRDDNGALILRLTQPVMNIFDADPGGAPRREGDQVFHDNLALTLTLNGDTLTGTFPGPNSPASLRRVNKLPSEAPVPKFPTGPAPRWETRIGGQVFASPVVADGVAYIGTTGGVFNAVKTSDGSFAWTFASGSPIYGAAAIDADAVYFTCDDGALYKLDRATGALRWRQALTDDKAATARVLPHAQVYAWDWQGPQPLLADGAVYVGDGAGVFHAVDVATGERRWRFATNGRIRHGAAVSTSDVVFSSSDKFVYALDRKSGKETWRSATRGEPDATPLVHDGRVYIGDRGAGLYALDATTGVSQWVLYHWGSWVESTPVMHDGVLYIGSSDLRRVSAISPRDGYVQWRSDVYGWTWGTPLVIGERIYAGAAGGTPYFIRHVAGFVTLDRRTGRVLSRWPLPDAGGHQWGIAGSPAASGDDVIVATIAGSLLALPQR